jgi:hypothetical protein
VKGWDVKGCKEYKSWFVCVREYVSMDVMGSLVCVENGMVVSSVCILKIKLLDV